MSFKFLLLGLLAIFYSSFSLASNETNFKQVVLFLGDSLTEGYGIDESESYASLLASKWQQQGKSIKVLNGSVSGSTSASALSRLRWFERARPTHLVLALGANDGLRGLEIAQTKQHLSESIDWALERDIQVLLVGMMMPPNYGQEYTQSFEKMFVELAQEKEVSLLPFLLEGVAGQESKNLADGIHPNAKGHRVMKRNVEAYLNPLLGISHE